MRRFIKAFFLVAGVIATSIPVFAASNPSSIPAVSSTAEMQALGAASPQYGTGVYVTSETAAGLYTWAAGSCSPDSLIYFQANGVATSVGCWKFTTPSWAFGGSAITGGIFSSGALTQSTIAGCTVFRRDSQVEASNCGQNTHALMSIGDGFEPTQNASVCTFTASATTGTMTVTAVNSCTIGFHDVITGAGITTPTIYSDFGSGTGGTGTYILSKNWTFASGTYTAYNPRQESALTWNGLNSAGAPVEMMSWNSGWTISDNTATSGIAYSAGCPLRMNSDGVTETEPCPIIAEGNASLLLGAATSGGAYATFPAGTVRVFNNLGGSTNLMVTRLNTGVAASTEYSTYTNLSDTTFDWATGVNIGSVGNTDFSIFNSSLGSNAVRIDNATNNVTLSSQLTVAGIPSGSGGTVVCAESDGHLFKATASITGVTCN